MKTFSELAQEITDPEILKLADRVAAAYAKEFDRRMAEGIGLYRPWDDQEEESEKPRPEGNSRA